MGVLSSFSKSLKLLASTNSSFSSEERINIYTELIINLKEICDQNIVIEDNILQFSFIDTTNVDVGSSSPKLQLSALNAIIVFLKCNRKDIQFVLLNKYISLALSNAAEIEGELCDVALRCFQSLLLESINHTNLRVEDFYEIISDMKMQKKFIESFQNVCIKLPIIQRVLFFHEAIFPALFTTENQEVRTFYRNLAFCLQEMDITLLNRKQLNVFENNIKTSYIVKINALLADKNPEWYLLYMALINYYGKMLNQDKEITNHLLKVPQTAFRSHDVTTLTEGFNCWKTIIDTYNSIDTNHLSDPHHLKLIIIPLQALVSRNIIVIHKQLDLWLYLISILKENFILCLEQFLNFCLRCYRNGIVLCMLEKPTSERLLWQDITIALLELMGHLVHNKNECCFKYHDQINFKLDGLIKTGDTFQIHGSLVIDVICDCSLLIFKCSDANAASRIIRCLWGSLFIIIEQLEQNSQAVALEQASLSIAARISNHDDNDKDSFYLLKLIMDLLLDKLFFPTEILNNKLIYPLVKNYIKHGNLPLICNDDLLVRLCCFGCKTSHSIDWFELFCEIFLNVKHLESSNNLLQLWVEVLPIIRQSVFSSKVESSLMDSSICFIIWPLLHIHELKLQQGQDCIEIWHNKFRDISKEYPHNGILILQDLRSKLKGVQIQNSRAIIKLLHHLCTQIMESDGQILLEDVLELASKVFTFKLDVNTQKLFLPILKDLILCVEGVTLTKQTLQIFCHCCENIITFQQVYEILEVLVQFFEEIPEELISSVPASFIKSIRSITIHENTTFAHNAAWMVSRFGKKLTNSSKSLSRGTKITNMITANSEVQKVSTFLDSDMLTKPLKGSLMSNSIRTENQVSNIQSNKNSIEHDNEEANFVLIDEHYKFNPDRLTDHQLEKFKERRSDIPALYEDLSQSQSASQCLTKIVQGADSVYMKKGNTDTLADEEPTCENFFKLQLSEKQPLEKAINTELGKVEDELQYASCVVSESNKSIDKNSVKRIKKKVSTPKRRTLLKHDIKELKSTSDKDTLADEEPTCKNFFKLQFSEKQPLEKAINTELCKIEDELQYAGCVVSESNKSIDKNSVKRIKRKGSTPKKRTLLKHNIKKAKSILHKKIHNNFNSFKLIKDSVEENNIQNCKVEHNIMHNDTNDPYKKKSQIANADVEKNIVLEKITD